MQEQAWPGATGRKVADAEEDGTAVAAARQPGTLEALEAAVQACKEAKVGRGDGRAGAGGCGRMAGPGSVQTCREATVGAGSAGWLAGQHWVDELGQNWVA